MVGAKHKVALSKHSEANQGRSALESSECQDYSAWRSGGGRIAPSGFSLFNI